MFVAINQNHRYKLIFQRNSTNKSYLRYKRENSTLESYCHLFYRIYSDIYIFVTFIFIHFLHGQKSYWKIANNLRNKQGESCGANARMSIHWESFPACGIKFPTSRTFLFSLNGNALASLACAPPRKLNFRTIVV